MDALNRLAQVVKRKARMEGFSKRTTTRYQVWVQIFLCWCDSKPPYRITAGHIENFRLALERIPSTGKCEVGEALDALAFLVGSVQDVEGVITVSNQFSKTGSVTSALVDDTTVGRRVEDIDGEIQTLEIGWQKGTSPNNPGDSSSASVRRATGSNEQSSRSSSEQRVSGSQQSPPPTRSLPMEQTLPSGEASKRGGDSEEPPSNAEGFIRRYQEQVEALHSSGSS